MWEQQTCRNTRAHVFPSSSKTTIMAQQSWHKNGNSLLTRICTFLGVFSHVLAKAKAYSRSMLGCWRHHATFGGMDEREGHIWFVFFVGTQDNSVMENSSQHWLALLFGEVVWEAAEGRASLHFAQQESQVSTAKDSVRGDQDQLWQKRRWPLLWSNGPVAENCISTTQGHQAAAFCVPEDYEKSFCHWERKGWCSLDVDPYPCEWSWRNRDPEIWEEASYQGKLHSTGSLCRTKDHPPCTRRFWQLPRYLQKDSLQEVEWWKCWPRRCSITSKAGCHFLWT